ncbi:MAG TPA: VOC family protein [Candidatus Methylomirabilis sp.]|nr:VOC family protein [Candidatus Methylomirabilis sp.]
MATTGKPVPVRIRTATPYLTVKDAARAIEFYKTAFGATESSKRYIESDGRVGHAEFTIGDAQIFISDEFPEIGVRGPQSLGGASSSIVLEVEDADAIFNQAVAVGATVVRPLKDEPYGRTGKLADPFGHIWFING